MNGLNDNSNYAVAIRYRDAILFYDAAAVEANRLKQNPADIIEKELQIWKNWYNNEIYNIYLECFNNKLIDFETIGSAKYVFGKANIQDAITNLLKVATEKYNYTPHVNAVVTNIENLFDTDYKVFLQEA